MAQTLHADTAVTAYWIAMTLWSWLQTYLPIQLLGW